MNEKKKVKNRKMIKKKSQDGGLLDMGTVVKVGSSIAPTATKVASVINTSVSPIVSHIVAPTAKGLANAGVNLGVGAVKTSAFGTDMALGSASIGARISAKLAHFGLSASYNILAATPMDLKIAGLVLAAHNKDNIIEAVGVAKNKAKESLFKFSPLWGLQDLIYSYTYVFTAFGFNPNRKTIMDRLTKFMKLDDAKMNVDKDVHRTVYEDFDYFYDNVSHNKLFKKQHYVKNDNIDRIQRITCVKYFKILDSNFNRNRKREYEHNDKFDILFVCTNGNITIPVVVRENIFSKKGIYLDGEKLNKLMDARSQKYIEYPVVDFLKSLGQKMNMITGTHVANDVLLVPCFCHDSNICNYKKKIDVKTQLTSGDETNTTDESKSNDEISKLLADDNTGSIGAENDVNALVQREIHNNVVETMSTNKKIFKMETQKFGYDYPFFIKNILQLQYPQQWIDDLMIQRSYDFFINNSDNNNLDYSMDIVPVMWMKSNYFKGAVGFGGIVASYYLLNYTDTGEKVQKSAKNIKKTVENIPEEVSNVVNSAKKKMGEIKSNILPVSEHSKIDAGSLLKHVSGDDSSLFGKIKKHSKTVATGVQNFTKKKLKKIIGGNNKQKRKQIKYTLKNIHKTHTH